MKSIFNIENFIKDKSNDNNNENEDQDIINFNDKKDISDNLDIKSKINTAKIQGEEEIKLLKQYTNDYIDKVSKLALAESFDLDTFFTDFIAESMIKNNIEKIFKGNIPYNMDEKTFKKLRLGYFKALIEKYINGSK